jgi:hypothetical protein
MKMLELWQLAGAGEQIDPPLHHVVTAGLMHATSLPRLPLTKPRSIRPRPVIFSRSSTLELEARFDVDFLGC